MRIDRFQRAVLLCALTAAAGAPAHAQAPAEHQELAASLRREAAEVRAEAARHRRLGMAGRGKQQTGAPNPRHKRLARGLMARAADLEKTAQAHEAAATPLRE